MKRGYRLTVVEDVLNNSHVLIIQVNSEPTFQIIHTLSSISPYLSSVTEMFLSNELTIPL